VISPYEQVKLSEPRGFADQTVRQVLHMAGGGERLRVRLTNRYGRTPLTIAAATVATEHGSAALTFDGTGKLTIPPGEEAVGDPIDLPVAPGADLFLSLNFPAETGLATYSHKPIETAHIVGGNHVTSAALPEAEEIMALPRSGTSPYVGNVCGPCWTRQASSGVRVRRVRSTTDLPKKWREPGPSQAHSSRGPRPSKP
jgi:hypothetical protein